MTKREFRRADIRHITERVRNARNTVDDASRLISESRMKVMDAVQHVIEKEYGSVLKTIPVEEINVDKSGIRTGLLKEHGLNSIYDVLNAGKPRIASIYGIGENMALKTMTIAQRIAFDIKKHIKLKLNLDNKSDEYSLLVKNVSMYIHAVSLGSECQELANEIPPNADIDLKSIKRASNPIKWLFVSESKKLEAIDAYNRLINGMSAVNPGPLSDKIQNIMNLQASDAWEHFASDSVSFFNALENIVPEHFNTINDGYGLSDDIRYEIESTQLNLEGLCCTLRGYQVWGVKYILRQQRVLLGDEMGLGKTVQAIAAMVALRNQGENHFLVVCPASVIINWCREVASKSDLNVYKVHGNGKELTLQQWLDNGGVAVTNYETLSGNFFIPVNFRISMVVVDEAHYIKNVTTKRSKNVLNLCEHTSRILFMTGTPLENNVSEMIRLLGFLQPEIADMAKDVSTSAYADYFKERISPVYYRRKREDVLAELPELVQMQDWCEMTHEDEAQYIKDVVAKNIMDVRRVSWRNPDYFNSSVKVQRLREIVDYATLEERKVIIFSFFLDTLEKVQTIFGQGCVGVINGSVPPAERQKIIDEFDAARPGTVLAAQIQSGGTGLNIQTASVVVICEPQYKPSVESQAISRAYRMGQTRNVLVHRLLCTNTIEERIMQILYEKQEEFNTFADDSAAARKDMELDNSTINSIMEDEIDRIRKKYTEDEIKLLTG
ncbi:MAG: DEAD/DEAH box helicase [Lachnospiraceae bacterium]|nr:DEAD/DEAH box helicase [Lachnospiraceae bacterium]